MSKQVTKINRKTILRCEHGALDLSQKCIMGILNLSPDSFYDGGQNSKPKKMLKNCEKLIDEGAKIIDLGAASSRPGSDIISENEEFRRLLPALKLLRNTFPEIIISIDTWRSSIAAACLESGADIINDISGGKLDKKMYTVLAQWKAPYVLMHMPGTPKTMQQKTNYKNVVEEVFLSLKTQTDLAKKAGIKQIIIDPGFGFGKTIEQNYLILKNLERFKKLELPILAGVSRKSMITKILYNKAEKALNGTSIINSIALLNGADILRVHDAKEAKEAIELINFYLSVK